jgi:sensor domain CHASE-containing protein
MSNTPAAQEEKRSWWSDQLTLRNIAWAVMIIVTVTSWYQAQEAFRQRIEERVTAIEQERIKHIETRLDTIDAATALTYVRRDVMTEQLAKMQSDVTALRDEVREVKIEIHKIR